METNEVAPTPGKVELAALLLRRWLAETHTAVSAGALAVTVGPLRLRTEVTYWSPTGAHGFGPIQVVPDDAPVTPMALAAACSADARARALPDAPINAPNAGSPSDCLPSIPDVFGDHCGQEAGTAAGWLDAHVRGTVLPAVRRGDDHAAWTQMKRALAAIGSWGRRGVADETELLAVLADCASESCVMVRELTASTVPDLGYLNGSGLRYRTESGSVRTVRYEVPNPLRGKPSCRVPGVPVPRLTAGWSVRPVRLADSRDVTLVHRWMNSAHVAAGWKQDWSLARWHAELAAQLGGDHSLPCVVGLDGREIGYVELYRVIRDTLAGCYPHHPRDLGVHVAIGEPDAVGRGLGSSLLRAVSDGLFAADPHCRRVVAEPDVHNGASIGAFRSAGFVRDREVGLPGKNAALMIRTRPGTTS